MSFIIHTKMKIEKPSADVTVKIESINLAQS